jgi:hypothetical protein
MVEYLKVLSLTVEPAYASLTVEYLKVLWSSTSPLLSLTVEPPKGTESLTIHMVRVRKHTRLSRPPSFELSLIFLTSFGGPISIKEAHSTVQERDGVTHYSYGEGPLPYGRVPKGP